MQFGCNHGQVAGLPHVLCTVGVKKTVTFSFRSVPFERRPLLHVRRSVSVLLARASAIICWACFADMSKIKRPTRSLALASRLESMLFHRHLLLHSAGTLYYCRCSILSVFCNSSSSGIAFSYRRSIELVPLIRSRLPLNVIA